jgi:N-methylhydantoinase A
LKVIEEIAESMGKRPNELIAKSRIISHATTLASNIVFTRTGAKVGLIITKGFEDTTTIMRGVGRVDGLEEMDIKHQTANRKPELLVSRPLIKGVYERVDLFGKVIVPLNEGDVKKATEELVKAGVEAIAVCLLWSFANPIHERRIKEIINSLYPNLLVIISHELVPNIREYARANTTILEAYLGRIVQTYLNSLHEILKEKGYKWPLLVMQAHGGVVRTDQVNAVSTFESGPAAGVIASKRLADLYGMKNVIATDVGGTTFKVSVVYNGNFSYLREPIVLRFRVMFSMIDVASIGAGGGTVAWIDSVTKTIKLGPVSAGSEPGPACYGRGGIEPTVTDADVVLGYINPDYFLGGKMKLDKKKAIEAIEKRIARPLNMDTIEAAAAIRKIIDANMSDLIRASVTMRGYDPREFIMFAYGSSGPTHGASYGAEIGVRKIVFPSLASVFSAYGLAVSDIVHSYKKTFLKMMPIKPDELNALFEEMEREGYKDMALEGFKESEVMFERQMEMRYGRQVYEEPIEVPTKKLSGKELEDIMNAWEAKYEQLYGSGAGYKEAGIECVSLRLNSIGNTPKIILLKNKFAGKDSSGAVKGKRQVYWMKINGFAETLIYDYQRLRCGNEIMGPAVIETPNTTMVILPEQKATVDEYMGISVEGVK